MQNLVGRDPALRLAASRGTAVVTFMCGLLGLLLLVHVLENWAKDSGSWRLFGPLKRLKFMQIQGLGRLRAGWHDTCRPELGQIITAGNPYIYSVRSTQHNLESGFRGP